MRRQNYAARPLESSPGGMYRWDTRSRLYADERLQAPAHWQVHLRTCCRNLKRCHSTLHWGICAPGPLWHMHYDLCVRLESRPTNRPSHCLHLARRWWSRWFSGDRALAMDLRLTNTHILAHYLLAASNCTLRQSKVPHSERVVTGRHPQHSQCIQDRWWSKQCPENL